MLPRRTTPNSKPRCRVCRQCLALKRCLPKTTCWMCLGIWQYLASSPFPKTKSWKSVREHGWLNRTSAYTLESKCADSDTLVWWGHTVLVLAQQRVQALLMYQFLQEFESGKRTSPPWIISCSCIYTSTLSTATTRSLTKTAWKLTSLKEYKYFSDHLVENVWANSEEEEMVIIRGYCHLSLKSKPTFGNFLTCREGAVV